MSSARIKVSRLSYPPVKAAGFFQREKAAGAASVPPARAPERAFQEM